MRNSMLEESLRLGVLSLFAAVLVVVAFVMFHFSSYQTVAY
jgi:hypothetical protein